MFKKSGFTLLEFLFAIAMIGLIVSIGARYFRIQRPGDERKKFISQLNLLMKFTLQNSIVTNKIHKVDFDFKKRVVQIFIVSEKKEEKDKRLVRTYLKTFLDIPPHLDIKEFFIDGSDMMKMFLDRKTVGVFFYVIPEGMSQVVIINIIDRKDEIVRGKGRVVSLVLNPFSAQFSVYNDFKRP